MTPEEVRALRPKLNFTPEVVERYLHFSVSEHIQLTISKEAFSKMCQDWLILNAEVKHCGH